MTHTGDEHAVDAAELNQAFGNPLKLEAPLKRGVRVIAAHCASEGYSRDFRDFSRKENFRLFLDMMDQKEYEGLLYAGTCIFHLMMLMPYRCFSDACSTSCWLFDINSGTR